MLKYYKITVWTKIHTRSLEMVMIKREFRPFRPLEFRYVKSMRDKNDLMRWDHCHESCNYKVDFKKIQTFFLSFISISNDWKEMLSIAKSLDSSLVLGKHFWFNFVSHLSFLAFSLIMNFMREKMATYLICKCICIYYLDWTVLI